MKERSVSFITLAVGGERINGWLHNTKGSRSLAIIIHGFAGNAAGAGLWELAAEIDELNINVLSIDFPGHGNASRRKFYPTIAERTEYLHSVISQLSQLGDFQKIYLIGYSQGGTTAVEYLKKYPEADIAGLCLLSPHVKLASFLDWYQPDGPINFGEEYFNEAKQLQVTDGLEVITQPTLVFYGLQDKSITRVEVDELYQKLSTKKQIHYLENEAHVYTKNFPIIAKEIKEFLIDR